MAHYFITRVEDSKTVIQDYLSTHPTSEIEAEDVEMTVSAFEHAILIEDENGLWDWYD